ncbi:MAG: MOSC domain-containing protein [Rhodobacteraceae bacterium]|nr:MOSC domain-containing protein [Paracoccaceae bacterium]
MPALMLTDYIATITFLGHVEDREASLASSPLDEVFVGFAGVATESRGGLTRLSCVRVKTQYSIGTEIRNTRQLSIISQEELEETANAMGVDHLKPEWLGASICVRGLPDFSHLPPSSRLQAPGGATLTLDMQNRPCMFPGQVIDKHHPGLGKRFKSAAVGRRGVTAWVEREGVIAVGDQLSLHIPDQRAWDPDN